MTFTTGEIRSLRRRFPALARTLDGRTVAYLDGPGGTQVPDTVIDAIAGVLQAGISNVHGGFPSSDLADDTVTAARTAVADLLNADPSEIVFGQNMTSLTFAVSRAMACRWSEHDEIVVTRLDHSANITPWRRAAADRGVTVRVADVDPGDGTLDPDEVTALIGPRTRLVAVTAASNALGTIPELSDIVSAAHAAGALVAVDAVHAAPHRTLDVRSMGCDILTASAYKFFGPHVGVQYLRAELLDDLGAYRVDPAPQHGPGKWETGTQSFESLAGVAAAVDYLAGLGTGDARRERLEAALERIRAYEGGLSARFLAGAASIPGLRVYGHADPMRVGKRTPTFAVGIQGAAPGEVSRLLAARGIFTWSGHYYAVEVMRRLGVLDDGGLVRIGFVHYSTPDEVDRVLGELASIAERARGGGLSAPAG